MQTVRMKKDELMKVVRSNRDKHRDTFLRAQEIYREDMIAELDRMLEEARAGKKIRRAFALPEPEEHTDDYDRVIAMLAHSVDDVIELQAFEYAQFVQDDWGWKAAFVKNTSSYLAKRR